MFTQEIKSFPKNTIQDVKTKDILRIYYTNKQTKTNKILSEFGVAVIWEHFRIDEDGVTETSVAYS